MASVIPVPPIKSSKPEILLIPWDPTSDEHVQRLKQQRTACGWDDEAVEGWRAAQEGGTLNLQWLVSSPLFLRSLLRISGYLTLPGSRRF